MYEKFYGLAARLFSKHPDPYFLYWGQNHSLAYSMPEYGVLNGAHARKITINIVQEVLGDRDKFGLVPPRPAGPPRLVKQHQRGSINDRNIA
jgi:hypothetical protein